MAERPPARLGSGGARKGSRVAGPFRIRAVAELTGVPEPTLRAWERRYGIPHPERTSSGYRMYSAHEVAQVRKLRALCDRGVPAAEAAKTVLADVGVEQTRAAVEFDPYDASVRAILGAVSRLDDRQLEIELRRLLFLGNIGVLLDRILTPALRRIGELWHDGTLSVAHEHLASQSLGVLLRDLLRLSAGAESHTRVLLACFADDDHELGLLATAIRFSDWGLRPLFLGARTPPAAVRSAIAVLSPALVALSVTVAPGPTRARELIAGYAEACAGLPWVVGGTGLADVADLVEEYGGMLAPRDAAELHAVTVGALQQRSAREPVAAKG